MTGLQSDMYDSRDAGWINKGSRGTEAGFSGGRDVGWVVDVDEEEDESS